MRLKTTFVVVVCGLAVLAADCSSNPGELERKEHEVLGIVKLGGSYAEARAKLTALGYRCTEPVRSQGPDGPRDNLFGQVILSEKTPPQSTFNEITGMGIKTPRTRIGIRLNDAGTIIEIK